MKNENKEYNEYRDARNRWAGDQTELFLNALERISIEMGIKIMPVQYVRAYKTCVEDLRFGYPAEYKITELIATDDTFEQVLTGVTAIMKEFRMDFQNKWKRRGMHRKKG